MNIVFQLNADQSLTAHFFELLKQASLLSKLVLLILVGFSIISWAVIIFKGLEYSRTRKEMLRFLNFYRSRRNYAEINRSLELFKGNPLAELYRAGMNELANSFSQDNAGQVDEQSIVRTLTIHANRTISRLEKLNGVLATTASATPFIGLFGTVWGIMNSFQNIGLQQNTSLATVAPGIAEALIATAFGLFAAIPAVIFYNFYLHRLKQLIGIIDEFILDFQNFCGQIKK